MWLNRSSVAQSIEMPPRRRGPGAWHQVKRNSPWYIAESTPATWRLSNQEEVV
jgi:hypothetical protein